MTLSPWRSDFPAMAALDAEGQTYLDSAATAQKPQAMLDCLLDYYGGGAANVHRAQHLPADRATRAFEAARATVARRLGVADSGTVVFTGNATEAFNLVAYGLETRIAPGDEIVVSALEHHANLLPWQQLARRRGAQLVVLPMTRDGVIDTDTAARLIGPRTRLLAVSQLSNVLGTWQPLDQLLPLARAQGATTVVDGAQGIVHAGATGIPAGCDFYACSAHKLYGPDGVGVLWGGEDAWQQLNHWQYGGEMVRLASFEEASFHPPPFGFEAGTPAIGAVIGFGAALNYLDQLDAGRVAAHERQLHEVLLDGLKDRGARLLGAPQAALASFHMEGVHSADLAHLLGDQGIAVRAGTHCAMPLYERLGLAGSIRVSLGLYNDETDLQRFFLALDQALELLR